MNDNTRVASCQAICCSCNSQTHGIMAFPSSNYIRSAIENMYKFHALPCFVVISEVFLLVWKRVEVEDGTQNQGHYHLRISLHRKTGDTFWLIKYLAIKRTFIMVRVRHLENGMFIHVRPQMYVASYTVGSCQWSFVSNILLLGWIKGMQWNKSLSSFSSVSCGSLPASHSGTYSSFTTTQSPKSKVSVTFTQTVEYYLYGCMYIYVIQ